MARWNALTEENKKDIYDMFDAGMTAREISELIGVKESTIYNYKTSWKKRNANNVPKVVEEAETKTEVSTGLADSDYAKAYMAEDPASVQCMFDIQRTVRIRSRKTGILYEMDNNLDKQVVKITLKDGQTINIELAMYEKLCDEGIDVFLEFKRTA